MPRPEGTVDREIRGCHANRALSGVGVGVAAHADYK